jgi:hypothetical protein
MLQDSIFHVRAGNSLHGKAIDVHTRRGVPRLLCCSVRHRHDANHADPACGSNHRQRRAPQARLRKSRHVAGVQWYLRHISPRVDPTLMRLTDGRVTSIGGWPRCVLLTHKGANPTVTLSGVGYEGRYLGQEATGVEREPRSINCYAAQANWSQRCINRCQGNNTGGPCGRHLLRCQLSTDRYHPATF